MIDQLAAAHATVAAKDGELARIEVRARKLVDDATRRDSILAERDAELEALRADIERSAEELSASQSELDRLRDKVSQSAAVLADREHTLARARGRAALTPERKSPSSAGKSLSWSMSWQARSREARSQRWFSRNELRAPAAQDGLIATLRTSLDAEGAAREGVQHEIAELKNQQERILVALAVQPSWFRRVLRTARYMASWMLRPSRQRFRHLATYTQLRRSGSFDADYYLSRNPEVARSAGLNPLMHYIVYGAAEGRDPSPTFSTQGYLADHPRSS